MSDSLPALLTGAALLLAACAKDEPPAQRTGPGDVHLPFDSGLLDGTDGTDGGRDGRGDGADGTGDPDGADGTGGTDGTDGTEIEPADEVCYLGEDRAGTTCLPVVAWSADFGSDYDYPAPLDDRYPAPARYLDLDAATSDPDLAVAPNFALGEFVSASKGRFGVYQAHAVQSLQWVRETVGGPVRVNSGYRSPGYNAGIDGSATHSRHMYGDAADIAASDVGIDALADICEDWGAGYVGTYTTHVHCDWRDDPLDPAFYDIEGEAAVAAAAFAPAVVHDAHLAPLDGGWLSAPATGFHEGEPLRTWSARDSRGRLVDRATGATYRPPPDAARVTVDIGRQVTLRWTPPGG